MKGDDKVVKVLNKLLADELTAISQYMVHSEMYADWGYDKLHEAIESQVRDGINSAFAMQSLTVALTSRLSWQSML